MMTTRSRRATEERKRAVDVVKLCQVIEVLQEAARTLLDPAAARELIGRPLGQGGEMKREREFNESKNELGRRILAALLSYQLGNSIVTEYKKMPAKVDPSWGEIGWDLLTKMVNGITVVISDDNDKKRPKDKPLVEMDDLERERAWDNLMADNTRQMIDHARSGKKEEFLLSLVVLTLVDGSQRVVIWHADYGDGDTIGNDEELVRKIRRLKLLKNGEKIEHFMTVIDPTLNRWVPVLK